MKNIRLVYVCALILWLGPALCPSHLAADEEGENFATIVDQARLAPAMRETVIELFSHLHQLEESFRDLRWDEAARRVEKIDLFYSKILEIARRQTTEIELSYLQAFEFSLSELGRGIRQQNRALTERQFLLLQPELFDILDKFVTTPLRLTASRYYVDLAILAVREHRFDIARDELGEIREYLEQLEARLSAKGLDVETLNRQLADAIQKVKADAPDSPAALARLRRTLDDFYQAYSTPTPR